MASSSSSGVSYQPQPIFIPGTGPSSSQSSLSPSSSQAVSAPEDRAFSFSSVEEQPSDVQGSFAQQVQEIRREFPIQSVRRPPPTKGEKEEELATLRWLEDAEVMRLPPIACRCGRRHVSRFFVKFHSAVRRGEDPEDVFRRLETGNVIKKVDGRYIKTTGKVRTFGPCCRESMINPVLVSKSSGYNLEKIQDKPTAYSTSAPSNMIGTMTGHTASSSTPSIGEIREEKSQMERSARAIPVPISSRPYKLRRRRSRKQTEIKTSERRLPPSLQFRVPGTETNVPTSGAAPLVGLPTDAATPTLAQTITSSSTSMVPASAEPTQIGGGLVRKPDQNIAPSKTSEGNIPLVVGERYYMNERDIGEGFKVPVLSGYMRTDPPKGIFIQT